MVRQYKKLACRSQILRTMVQVYSDLVSAGVLAMSANEDQRHQIVVYQNEGLGAMTLATLISWELLKHGRLPELLYSCNGFEVFIATPSSFVLYPLFSWYQR